jgi:hypothetical protein
MSEQGLPNGERARVEEDKIRLYLLNLEHDHGGPKAKFFLNRGFTAQAWIEMGRALVAQARTNPLAKTVQTQFGVRHIVDCNCPTPDALNPCIRTVWETLKQDDGPRLITAHPLD